MAKCKVRIYIKADVVPVTTDIAFVYRTIISGSYGRKGDKYNPAIDLYCEKNGAFVKAETPMPYERAGALGNLQAVVATLSDLPRICEEYEIYPEVVEDDYKFYQMYTGVSETAIQKIIPKDCLVTKRYPINVEIYLLDNFQMPAPLLNNFVTIDDRRKLTSMERYAFTAVLYLVQMFDTVTFQFKLEDSSLAKYGAVDDILSHDLDDIILKGIDHNYVCRYHTENFVPDRNPESIYIDPIMKLHEALRKWYNTPD